MPDDQQSGGSPRRLETIFLTGPGGLVYEFPRDLAAAHVVTPQRIREIGDLPIIPYGTADDDGEVGGRHLVAQSSGASAFHRDVRFGVYRWSDGYYYQGEHFHPNGDEVAQPV